MPNRTAARCLVHTDNKKTLQINILTSSKSLTIFSLHFNVLHSLKSRRFTRAMVVILIVDVHHS